MAEFLEAFDVERGSLLQAVDHLETVWSRFQERQTLEADTNDLSSSLISGELALVRKDLESTKFTVGIFGLIKRGKSTLMNAVIGREVSAMHVTPETAVPVYVDYGEEPGATIHFADGSVKHVAVEDVAAFTSQKHNGNNELGVTYVHQVVPVGFLRNGARIIDTPGLDDAEADEVYTQRTMQELENSDAGIVVFLSPPTVGGQEMAFLQEVAARNLKKVFIVCNMYPQHFHDTETRNAVLEYVGGRIVEASRDAGGTGEVRVYPVCALEAWQARLDEDVMKWRRSGADRLMREMETFLGDVAGSQVLMEASERIVNAAGIAKAEVSVRQQLLEDPTELGARRAKVDEQIKNLESEFDRTLHAALAEIEPLRMRIRGLLMKPFSHGKQRLAELKSSEEIKEFNKKFSRELVVAGEIAKRQYEDAYSAIVDRLRGQLEDHFHSVMTDLSANIQELSINTRALLITEQQELALRKAEKGAKRAAVSGATLGGIAGGGATVMAISAALGPIGLLGGALAGWLLSEVRAGGGSTKQAADAVSTRLEDISRRLIADFDEQVDRAVETLRLAVARRRKAFAADLYQQFDLVEGLVKDPEMLDSYRRDAARFVEAFEACAARARKAVAQTVADETNEILEAITA